MSRARALELIALAGFGPGKLPDAETELTWWTVAADIGHPANALLSAMEQLRDERWVLGSATPIGAAPIRVACVFRRLSLGEDNALRMQGQAMIVGTPGRGPTR